MKGGKFLLESHRYLRVYDYSCAFHLSSTILQVFSRSGQRGGDVVLAINRKLAKEGETSTRARARAAVNINRESNLRTP